MIAVIDSGVDRDHPDLAGRLVGGTDIRNGDTVPEDFCGHGTHVSGNIGAATANDTGVAGVNWNAAILPVKVTADLGGNCGSIADSDIAAGIRFAVASGASVLNLSLGGPGRNEDVAKAPCKRHGWPTASSWPQPATPATPSGSSQRRRRAASRSPRPLRWLPGSRSM